jgi:hypothetical protein
MHYHHLAALAQIRAEEMQNQARVARQLRGVDERPRSRRPARLWRASSAVVATVRRQLAPRA